MRPGVWSKARALERLDGNETLLADAAKILLDELPAMISTLRKAVEASDGDVIERVAHTMKSSLSYFAAACTDLAGEVERAGYHSEFEKAAALLVKLEMQLGAFTEELQKVIA